MVREEDGGQWIKKITTKIIGDEGGFWLNHPKQDSCLKQAKVIGHHQGVVGEVVEDEEHDQILSVIRYGGWGGGMAKQTPQNACQNSTMQSPQVEASLKRKFFLKNYFFLIFKIKFLKLNF